MSQKGQFDFKLPLVGNCYIDAHMGQVLEAKTWSSTHVSGGGGGAGYVAPGGMMVSNPVRVSSTTTEHTQVFLRKAGGQEMSLRMNNVPLDLRKDNYFSAMFVHMKDRKKTHYIYYKNNSTGDAYRVYVKLSWVGSWMEWFKKVAIIAAITPFLSFIMHGHLGRPEDFVTGCMVALGAGTFTHWGHRLYAAQKLKAKAKEAIEVMRGWNEAKVKEIVNGGEQAAS